MKTFHIDNEDISDGYHTFGELYAHRCALYVRLCMAHAKDCAWKHDEDTRGWIILYWESPDGQISYHVPDKYIPRIERAGIVEDPGYIWDGHNSHDVLVRLESL